MLKINHVDVILVSKDREKLCYEQIERINKYIPYCRIILMDSSEIPYSFNKDGLEYYHTPNYKLGVVRHFAYSRVTSDIFISLDDDIIINENTYYDMIGCLYSDNKNVGVTALIVDGYPDNKTIMKLFENKRKYSYAMGCCMFYKDKFDAIGNFWKDVDIGEDIIIAHNIRKRGLKWNICNTKVYHHVRTWNHEFKRSWRNTKAIMDLWKKANMNPIEHIIISFGRLILMPFYYAFKTKDIKIYFLYFGICLMKFTGNVYHFFKGFKRWFE